ncbi:MAG: methyltransferase domain-containing protein [Anaerolineaceae bacterium]|nr:methyltransferase domain-containing protein [Anaerolineaceae bacterium]
MDQYKGFLMRTAPGLHEAAFSLLARFHSGGASVLDLGAGEGALALRLSEAGYACEAVELLPDRFQVEGVPCHNLDLNGDFAAAIAKTFDVVAAIEIIEHLENPRHFLAQCRQLLSPGGIILLSTPNIEDVYSRLRFLARGRFSFFRESHYDQMGHITPLAGWQLRQIFRELDLAELAHEYNRPFRRLFVPRNFSELTKLVAGLLAWPLTIGVRGGQVHLFALRPGKPGVD